MVLFLIVSSDTNFWLLQHQALKPTVAGVKPVRKLSIFAILEKHRITYTVCILFADVYFLKMENCLQSFRIRINIENHYCLKLNYRQNMLRKWTQTFRPITSLGHQEGRKVF